MKRVDITAGRTIMNVLYINAMRVSGNNNDSLYIETSKYVRSDVWSSVVKHMEDMKEHIESVQNIHWSISYE